MISKYRPMSADESIAIIDEVKRAIPRKRQMELLLQTLSATSVCATEIMRAIYQLNSANVAPEVRLELVEVLNHVRQFGGAVIDGSVDANFVLHGIPASEMLRVLDEETKTLNAQKPAAAH